MKFIIVACLLSSTCSLLPPAVCGQSADPDIEDRLSEREKEEGAKTEFAEQWMEQESNRKNINAVNTEELLQANCVSELQANALMLHRKLLGPILCLEELQTIPEMDHTTIECIKGHFHFPARYSMPDEITGDFTQDLMLEVTGSVKRQSILGTQLNTPSPVHGDNLRSVLRLRTSTANGMKSGLNFEKDAYEAWWSKKGPDHTGWFIQLAPRSKPWSLNLGDYYLNLGQGLLFGLGSFSAAGGDVISLIRTATGARPYTSTGESGFLKGVCFSYRFEKIRMSCFASRTMQDGRVVFSSDSLHRFFTEDPTGYHRTEEEQRRERINRSQLFGCSAVYIGKRLKLGTTLCRLQNELPPIQSEEPYRIFRATGQEQSCLSLDYRYSGKRLLVFGESVINHRASTSSAVGILLHPDRRVSAGISLRRHDRSFGFQYSNPVEAVAPGAGESGLQAVFNIRLNDRLTIQAMHDQYVTNWLTYDCITPVRGGKDGVRIILTKGKSTETVIQLKSGSRTASYDATRTTLSTIERKTLNFRIQLTHRPAFGIQIRHRTELLWERFGERPSFFTYQEMRFPLKHLPVTAVIRTSVFNTTDYQHAIYAQESMPVNNYGSSINFGTGWRNYLMIHAVLTKQLDGWIRFGRTRVFDRKLTDEFSGTSGDIANDVMLQLRWRKG